MKITKFLAESFVHDPVPTEYYVYQKLIQLKLDLNQDYFAAPLAHLINTGQAATLAQLEKLNTPHFAVCQHIRFQQILPLLKRINVRTVFSPHASQEVEEGCRIIPFMHYPIRTGSAEQEKDIFYSFIGLDSTALRNKTLRREIFNLSTNRNDVVIKERKAWHWKQRVADNQESRRIIQKEKEEYQNILTRSRFSLSPRGTGAGTIRFWESLKSGAIPVLLSDDIILPKGFDWEECIVRIPENQVGQIERALEQISPEREQTLRQNGLKISQELSGEGFIYPIIRELS